MKTYQLNKNKTYTRSPEHVSKEEKSIYIPKSVKAWVALYGRVMVAWSCQYTRRKCIESLIKEGWKDFEVIPVDIIPRLTPKKGRKK